VMTDDSIDTLRTVLERAITAFGLHPVMVCMYVCVYVCEDACMHVCRYVCLDVYVWMSYVWVYVCITMLPGLHTPQA
jgi:hypothetical protein